MQNPVTLPSLTIFLAVGSPTVAPFPNGVYIGGIGGTETLFMGSNGQFASLSFGGTNTSVCLTTIPGLAGAVQQQWLNPQLLFVQDGAAYGWGDGRPSGVKLIPARKAPPLNTLPPLPCPYAEIVIPGIANPGPAGAELLLFNSLTPPTVFTIAPAAYALAHWNIVSLGG